MDINPPNTVVIDGAADSTIFSSQDTLRAHMSLRCLEVKGDVDLDSISSLLGSSQVQLHYIILATLQI